MALGAALALCAPALIQPAGAAQWTDAAGADSSSRKSEADASSKRSRSYAAARYGRGGSTLQCVPFARENSGIELVGNAATWWHRAAGIYERGNKPEVGSVLNFRANGRMRLGHVAVVSRVIDSRTLEIDHANWSSRGAISRNISVVDVSPDNQWTAVRVELGQSDTYGSIYPTYGFIYDRPDRGMTASVGMASVGAAPSAATRPPLGELRPTGQRIVAALNSLHGEEEVAEAADDVQSRVRRAWSLRANSNNGLPGVASPAQPR